MPYSVPKLDDYSPAALESVRQRYFSTSRAYPEKAFDGGPFHAYFYGLLKADAEYVVHMDSDMLFGGGSQVWLEEAIGWLRTTPDALFAGPLPGPPRADGTLGDLHGSFPGLTGIRPPERLAGCCRPARRSVARSGSTDGTSSRCAARHCASTALKWR